MFSRILVALLLLTSVGLSAHAADPTPYLQVETGRHQATINRLVLLSGGQKIATVSDDKTARLWSADTLEPLGVIRPPIGPDDDGALDAVAASGNILAVAGRIRYGTMFGVQFYRLPDLKLIGHRSELPAPVSALGFSLDGHTLAVGMVADRGLAFFDMRSGLPVATDAHYRGQVQWIDFAADGRTVTSGQDGRIRLYSVDHVKIAEVDLPRAGHPYAVTFAPDGQTIAVGVQDSPLIWLLDSATLRPISSLSGEAGRIGGFGIVAFTQNGKGLVAGGTYKASANTPRLVRRWAFDTGRSVEFEAGSDTVTDLLPLDGGVLLSGAEPVLSRFDNTGRQLSTL